LRIRWVLAVLALMFAVYFALFGGEYNFQELRKLDRDRALEEARVKALEVQLVQLRNRADSLEHDSATLERIAREKYGLIKSGERLYRFVDSIKPSPRDTSKNRE
jgi:cell division protein FtsB